MPADPYTQAVRGAYIRVLRDGAGHVLPSEAARKVAEVFDVSTEFVLLTMLNRGETSDAG